MPKLLIVASKLGYQTQAFVAAAESLGVEAVLVTDRCHRLNDPWGDHAVPFRESGEIGYADGIIAIGDRPAPVAAELAAHLGIPFHPAAAVEAARNKFLARERFRAAGLPVPRFFRVAASSRPDDALAQTTFPAVLKPLGLSGSRGVIRANDSGEFRTAFARIRAILESPDIRQQRDETDRFLQIEQYIPGREYALEGTVSQGRFSLLALFDKPDPLEGPFFEETIYVTPSRTPAAQQAEMIEATQKAVTALGLTDGPLHGELRWNEQGPWVLEVAGRPIGGLCARVLRFEGGVTLEQILIQHALGKALSPLPLEGGAAGVMMIPIPHSGQYQGVAGLDEARATPCLEDAVITAQEGQEMKALPEGSSYLGFLFSRASTPAQAEAALRQAHGRLTFQIAPLLPVLGPTRT